MKKLKKAIYLEKEWKIYDAFEEESKGAILSLKTLSEVFKTMYSDDYKLIEISSDDKTYYFESNFDVFVPVPKNWLEKVIISQIKESNEDENTTTR